MTPFFVIKVYKNECFNKFLFFLGHLEIKVYFCVSKISFKNNNY